MAGLPQWHKTANYCGPKLCVFILELGPINRLRYRQSITISNNRIIENNNTAYLRYTVLKYF